MSHQKPSGARRTREHFKVGFHKGTIVPGEVVSAEGEVIDPAVKIRDVFAPGHNECIVRFGPTFGADCGIKQPIAAFGLPKAYFSPFAQRAFYSQTATSLKQYDALKERVENKVEEQNNLVTRWELGRNKGKKQMSQEDVMAANFKKVMADQTGFGDDDVLNAADAAIAIQLAVGESFRQMSMCRNNEISVADQDSLKELSRGTKISINRAVE